MKPSGVSDVMVALRARIEPEEQVRWKRRGEPYHPWRKRATVFDLLAHELLPRANVGDFFILDVKDDGRFGVRCVDTFPAPVATVGNDRVDMGRGYWVSLKVGAESWGILSCRRIAGSSSWSQHAYVNAEDIHATAGGMLTIANGFVDNADRLHPAHVIYNRRDWEPGAGWSSYGGTNPHTDHVHVDYVPQGTGTPPCAR